MTNFMPNLIETLARRWWLVVLRGVLAVIFGFTAWIWPGLTASTLIILVGAYAAVDGVMKIVFSTGAKEPGRVPGRLCFRTFWRLRPAS